MVFLSPNRLLLGLLSFGLALNFGDIARAAAPAAASPIELSSPPQLALVRYRRRAYRRPRWGAPRWSYGGAARGGCSPEEQPLVPLVPVDSQGSEAASFLGMTGAAYPQLLVYVPATSAESVELLVIDENRDRNDTAGQVIYQRQLPVPQSPAIIRFDLAEAETALAVDRHYTWTASLVCDPLDPSGNPFVRGLIQRVEAPVASLDTTEDPYSRINAYAAAGLWHETVAALAELRCRRPDDAEVTTDWRDLLFSLELSRVPELLEAVQTDDIANAPLLFCPEVAP